MARNGDGWLGREMKPHSSRPPAPDGSPESAERASLEALVEAVIGAAYEVSNVLGAGFLEKVYERALMEEIHLRGLRATAQAPFPVSYKGKHVGTYSADLVVDGRLLVEVKCVEQFSNEHLAQCINYLKASGLHLALLINFRRSRVEWKRVVLDL
jgi:GxxExxY protein